MSHSAGLSRAYSYHEVSSAAHAAWRGLMGARMALSRLRPDRGRPAWHRTPHPAAAPVPPAREQVQVGDIRFRRLRSAGDIACVLPLRREINLPRAGEAGFAALEKKEMSAALSAHSNTVDKSSARSASCRWGAASRPARTSWPAPNCRPNCLPMGGK